MPRGGSRQGAGRRNGSKNKSTKVENTTLSAMAKSYAPEALEMLAEVMRYGVSDAARVAASIALLDRAFGRPKSMDPEPVENSFAAYISEIQQRGSKPPIKGQYVEKPGIAAKPVEAEKSRTPHSGNQMCLKIAEN